MTPLKMVLLTTIGAVISDWIQTEMHRLRAFGPHGIAWISGVEYDHAAHEPLQGPVTRKEMVDGVLVDMERPFNYPQYASNNKMIHEARMKEWVANGPKYTAFGST